MNVKFNYEGTTLLERFNSVCPPSNGDSIIINGIRYKTLTKSFDYDSNTITYTLIRV